MKLKARLGENFARLVFGRQAKASETSRKPFRGYAYGSWLPRLHAHHFKSYRNIRVDLSGHWLIWHAGLHISIHHPRVPSLDEILDSFNPLLPIHQSECRGTVLAKEGDWRRFRWAWCWEAEFLECLKNAREGKGPTCPLCLISLEAEGVHLEAFL